MKRTCAVCDSGREVETVRLTMQKTNPIRWLNGDDAVLTAHVNWCTRCRQEYLRMAANWRHEETPIRIGA